MNRTTLPGLLALLLGVIAAQAANTTRDIYSTQPGNTGLSLASIADCENGCQGVTTSTSTFHSAPHGLRLKFTGGVTRGIVGIRFINPDWTPGLFNITPAMKLTGALEFWVNPKASPNVPTFSVGLVSDSNGIAVETRVPLSNYLEPGDYADAWTYVQIPFVDFFDTGFSYDPVNGQISRAFVWSRVRGLNLSANTTASGFYDPSIDDVRFISYFDPLTVQGENLVKSDGATVRLWGVNMVSTYPSYVQAENLATNLASLGINAVRLHHLMRNSPEWNPFSGIGALATYSGNTRTAHNTAWDRFDYLNAQLRYRGIYLLLSLDSTRRYLPGDVDILVTNSADRTRWMDAMTALNNMPSNLDLVRMLPMIDERAALLMEEFTRRLLTRVNPYTGVAYGFDPQVIYLETMNETSSEYAVVAGNKFTSTTHPAVSYWKDVLQAKWAVYTSANGVAACDIYSPTTTAQKLARGDFLRGLDQAYFTRMKNLVRSLNCQTPMTFSNLWRGEAFQKMHASVADIIEDHHYIDPFVVRSADDIANYASRSAIVGKPYIVGELNQLPSDAALNANAPYRNMLQLASAAYGCFNNWAGVTWFAWQHGDRKLANDGWSTLEERRPASNADMIGQINSDGMVLDHLRTAGYMFKKGLVAKSSSPKTLFVDDPCRADSYSSLITPKYQFVLGWQNIYSIRRAFGTVPASQPTAPWMTTTPAHPYVSDTGQICKSTVRQQLTITAPMAEGFSGKVDGQPPTGPTHMQITGSPGSATLILVATDGLTLGNSQSLILSRTYLTSAGAEIANPGTTLTLMKAVTSGMSWHIRRTRPRPAATSWQALASSGGTIVLPSDGWHECELRYAPVGSLP